MSENGGAYFPVRAGFCRDRAARALRRRHGWEGIGQFVGLCCMLLEEPENLLDVSTDYGMEDLAEQLSCMPEELTTLLTDMAKAGMLDADALGDGVVKVPIVDEAIEKWEAIIEAKREAGRKSGESRRRKAYERRSNSC